MKRIQLIVLLIITCISGAAASGKYVRVFDFTGGELGQKEPVNSSTIYGLNSGFGNRTERWRTFFLFGGCSRR